MTREVKVFVIEEVRAMRERIAATIEGIATFQLGGQASNVEEALERIAVAQPDVVLMDADMPGADDKEIIRKILGIAPAAGIIGTSRYWNESAARLAVKAGAKGYLPKPFTEEELIEAVGSIDDLKSSGKSEAIHGKVITLFSPKGGCGKTTLAANLAVGLAKQQGRKVGVVDADLQFGDIPIFWNIAPVVTVVDAARDLEQLSPGALRAYLTPYGQSIRLLAAAARPEQAELIRGKHISAILAMMRSLFHYVVVDTAPGFHEISLAAIQAADIVYVVAALSSGQELDHVRRSLETFRSLRLGQDKVKVVLSRVNQKDLDSLKRLEEELGYPVAALLPNDFRLTAVAVNDGVPLVISRPKAPLAKGILSIVGDITADEVMPQTLPQIETSFMAKFFRQG